VGKILLLDDLTANQIAAGEVIERPASAVKELVENSLDAGATAIDVEIRGGGLEYLRVTDNGSGMSQEDLLLAVKRHATSKLKTISDLESLRTLGFRGEALPSIVSVAKVEILSREAGQEHGYRLVIEGNVQISLEPAGSPVGTSIVVKELFFNTPARRKFLRSEGYEAGLIHELLIQFALGHPQVDFRLLNEGKEILNTRGINKLEELIQLFYGREVQKALIPVEGQASQGSYWGYVTLPTFHRANRRAIHFFVNSRKVIAKEILQALESAYENTLPKGRFPLAVLNITFDPALLDVNVHPGKLEIRIRDQFFAPELSSRLKGNLSEQRKIPTYSLLQKPLEPAPTPVAAPERPLARSKNVALPSQEVWKEFYTWQPELEPTGLVRESSPGPALLKEENIVIQDKKDTTGEQKQPSAAQADKQFLPPLRVIGQLSRTFILAEGEEGLYVIDQHVAHERVLFEQLLNEADQGKLNSQVLLTPCPLELTLLEEELLIQHILALHDLGLVIEHFGPRTYLIRAVPTIVKEDPADFLLSLLQQLEKEGEGCSPSDLKREVLITASCKGAVKAGDKLSDEAILRLVEDLRQCNSPLTCPHGRPIVYKITHNDLLKAFRRI